MYRERVAQKIKIITGKLPNEDFLLTEEVFSIIYRYSNMKDEERGESFIF